MTTICLRHQEHRLVCWQAADAWLSNVRERVHGCYASMQNVDICQRPKVIWLERGCKGRFWFWLGNTERNSFLKTHHVSGTFQTMELFSSQTADDAKFSSQISSSSNFITAPNDCASAVTSGIANLESFPDSCQR